MLAFRRHPPLLTLAQADCQIEGKWSAFGRYRKHSERSGHDPNTQLSRPPDLPTLRPNPR